MYFFDCYFNGYNPDFNYWIDKDLFVTFKLIKTIFKILKINN